MFFNKTAQSNTLADQAVQSTDHAIRSTQRVANETLDSIADSVRGASHQLQERALRVSDSTVNYIRNEPVKSVLIAAATGAALVAVASLLSGSRQRH